MKGTAYLIQGTLVSLWWLGLAINNNFYKAFQFPNIPEVAFNSFFIPDVILITSLSVLRAYRPYRELELIILGGFAYGSFYCLNASILSSGGYLPTTVMFLGLFYNLFLVYQSEVFKEAKCVNDISIANRLKAIIESCENEDIQNKNITLHTLRHSIATHLMQNKVPMKSISTFLGHASLESTQLYTHLAKEMDAQHSLGNAKR